MRAGDDGDHFVDESWPYADAVILHLRGQDRHVDPALEQRLHRMVGRIRNDVDADARVFAGERREQPGQPPIPGVALGAHANDAGRVSGEQPDVFLRPDEVVENPPRALEHRRPAAVRTMRRPTRRKKGVSNRASISLSWWLRADWVR